jgi:predicted small lipoprotein YifL
MEVVMKSWKSLTVAVALVTAVAACGPKGPGPESPAVTESVEAETATSETAGAEAAAPVGAMLREMYAEFGRDTRYFVAAADLDGDGDEEVIVHVAGPMVCGTGGCNTLVFTPRGSGYELVGDISVTRPPIRVSRASTNGWRNLIVHISGGGIQSIDGEVPFDGATYQSNPTAPMVAPAADLDTAEIVIPEFQTFSDGMPLFTE